MSETTPPGVDEPVELRLAVDVGPERAALDVRELCLLVDQNAVHRREVDHHAAIRARQSGDRVPAAADCDLDPAVAREVDGGDDVRRPLAQDDEPGPVGVHRAE